MVVASQLVARVSVEGADEAKGKLSEVDRKTKETEGGFKEFAKHALEMAGVFKAFELAGEGVDFLKEQFVDTIKTAINHQQIMAQTNQVLKSTHDVSGMTAESLDKLATAFSQTTEFSADTVQGGENLLLTFTNIGKQVFPQATQAILDVSQAMGQDLKSSAIQVGKALGDPLTGMTALQRIGVTFSKDEKEQIKTMMAHNDIIGAQKIILHELSTEFGGSATAAGKTFGGQLAILQNQFEDIKIKIGTALLPVLSDMLNKYVIPLASRFTDWLTKGGGLNDFQNLIKTMTQFMQSQFLPAMNDLLNKYVLPLAQDMYDLFIKSGLLSGAWNDLKAILNIFLPILGDFVQWVLKGGPGVTALGVAIAGVATIVAGFKLASWLNDVNKGINDVIKNFNNWKNTASEFLDWLKGSFSPGASQAIENVGTSASNAGNEVESIGTKAQVAEGEVATASAEEDASLAGVGVEAGAASTGIKGIGLSALGAAAPLLLIAGALTQILEDLKSPFVVPGSNDQSLAGLLRTMSPGGLWNLVNSQQPSPSDHMQHTSNANILPGSLNPTYEGGPVHGHYASGVTDFMGGLAYVHAGELLVNMPRGTSVIPANQVSAAAGQGPIQVQVDVYLDGARTTRQLMPHIVDSIRNATGWRH